VIVCSGILFIVGIVIVVSGRVMISGGRLVTGTRARVIGLIFMLPVPLNAVLNALFGAGYSDYYLVETAVFFLCLLLGVIVGLSADSIDTKRPAAHADLPPVLTVAEAARYLRVSEGEVRRLIQTERLRAAWIGSKYRISKEALDDFMR
jgi:excisionase family DNA binding protein